MRYLNKGNILDDEYRRIFLASLGKYFQIILVELGRKDLNIYEQVNSGNLFNLPSDSHWTTLGEVIEFSSNLNIQAKLTPHTIINYVDIDAIDNKEYRIREVKLKTVSELSSRARRLLKKGYMVYSLVRPYLNNLAIIEVDKENFIGSTGFAVFKGTGLSNEYIKLILLSDYVRQRFLEMLSGFNSPTITHEQFTQTPVPFVPKNLQAAIVDFLSDLERGEIKEDYTYFDKKVESKVINLHKSQLIGNRLLNEIATQTQTLQFLRQTILQEAVQGKLTKQNSTDEPATALLKRIKAEKQKLIKAGKLKKEKELPPITEDEISFDLPKGWVWCRLGELVDAFLGGFAFKSSDLQKEDRNQVLRLGNVKNDKALLTANPVYIDDKIAALASSNELFAGDILITMTGTRLKRDYCYTVLLQENDFNDKRLFLNQRVGCLRLNKEMNFDFINIALKAENILDDIFKEETGTANQGNIGVTTIKKCLFPLPPLAQQQRIVAKVQQLQQQLSQLEAQVQQSREYAQQLLQSVLREAFEEKGKVYEMGDERAWMVAEE